MKSKKTGGFIRTLTMASSGIRATHTDEATKQGASLWRYVGKASMYAIMAAMLGFAAPSVAQAGKEGVYVADATYFTLNNVRFTAASDDSVLRFAVNLHNGLASPIDYNYYGVRVTDDAGFSYFAQLTGSQSARVQPGTEKDFAYEAHIPKGVRADQLRVTLFAWNYGSGAVMNDLGSLSVANAMSEEAGAGQEAIVSLASVDASLADDAKVAWTVGGEYAVYENGEWNAYLDLLATNRGTESLSLPAGLKMRLENTEGQRVTATAINGADKTLLPGKPQKITVKASSAESSLSADWSLQFYATGSDSSDVVLDSLTLGAASQVLSIGDSRVLTDSQGNEGVTLTFDSASVSQATDSQWVRAKVTASNTGSRVAAIPSLSANYQSVNGGVTIGAGDTAVHPAYLSPGESETFTYTALLPIGLTTDELQLAVFETRGSSSSTNTASSNTTSTGGSGGSSSSSGASATQQKVPVFIAGLGAAERIDQQNGVDYTLGASLALPLDHKMDVAITELKLYDNDNYGYKTAVAKLKWTNLDNTAYALPELAVDAVDENGRIYTGTRQTNVITQLATNSSYMTTYSFMIPDAVEGQPLALRLYNDDELIPIQTVKVGIEQEQTEDDVWDVYPYKVTVNRAILQLNGTLSTTFSYALQLDVSLERTAQLLTDATVSKLQFDLQDASGLILSTQTLPFQGTTRLLDGDNTLTFTNLKLNQFNSTNFVNVYEVIDTPNGTVKHKIGEIH